MVVTFTIICLKYPLELKKIKVSDMETSISMISLIQTEKLVKSKNRSYLGFSIEKDPTKDLSWRQEKFNYNFIYFEDSLSLSYTLSNPKLKRPQRPWHSLCTLWVAVSHVAPFAIWNTHLSIQNKRWVYNVHVNIH